jgi:hypothetical protein
MKDLVLIWPFCHKTDLQSKVIPNKIPGSFWQKSANWLKIYTKFKQPILKKEEKVGRFKFPDFKTHDKT